MSGLLLFPLEAGQRYFIASSPGTALTRNICVILQLGQGSGATTQDTQCFWGCLVDFSQSCVKTIGLFYMENKSWRDPACPDVLVLEFAFSAWCPALPAFIHPQMGTARP